MGDIKQRVGEKAGPYQEEVTLDRLRKFGEAVGARLDPGAEGDSLPTFPTVFRKGEFELFSKLGVPLSRILHAEQEYEYHASLRAGMTVSFESRLARFNEKRGGSGALSFMTFETLVSDAVNQERLLTSRTTIVVKGGLE